MKRRLLALALPLGMTTRCAYAFIVLIAGISLSAAQTQPTIWQGAVTIMNLNGTCTSVDGLRVGQLGTAVYRPRIGTSGASRVQFIWTRAAANYRKIGGGQMRGSGGYSATKLGAHAAVADFNGNFSFKQAPATVTNTTINVTLKGNLTNFQGQATCTATINAVFTKRPAAEG